MTIILPLTSFSARQNAFTIMIKILGDRIKSYLITVFLIIYEISNDALFLTQNPRLRR